MPARPFLIAVAFQACFMHGVIVAGQETVVADTITLFDGDRERPVPIAIYHRAAPASEPAEVVVISHGYNAGQPGTYLRFSSLAGHLVANGYVVVSVQHELPTDPPLAMNGDLRKERLPNWERGVANLRFVLDRLQKERPDLDLGTVALVGHSNGGDISMLFAQRSPERVKVAISLDNLRMPLPRTRSPRIASLRAEDTTADPGVLPELQEAEHLGMVVIAMHGFKHVDFNDRGSDEQRRRMNQQVLDLLSAR